MAHQDGADKRRIGGSLAWEAQMGDTIPIRWTLSWIVHMRLRERGCPSHAAGHPERVLDLSKGGS